MKLIFSLCFLLSLSAKAQGKIYSSQHHKFKVEILTQAEGVIWGFDFLPNQDILYTLRKGELYRYDRKSQKSHLIQGTPRVRARGQGGLLDVRHHPQFHQNRWIYLVYSEPVGEDKMTTAVGRGKLKKNKLTQWEKFFSAKTPNEETRHFGSRLVFDADGYLFFSVGDRGQRDKAQSLAHHQGSIIRLHADGSVPKDNPFFGQKDALPEVWSYGHRNPQGLDFHPQTKELWEAEFGPKGGDELNLIQKGLNYGWPVITYGREYYGPKIGTTHKEGMEQPIAHWEPSISPSGMAFYSGKKFSQWNGDIFLANLSSRHVRRLKLKGKKVAEQEELLKDLNGRFRQVRSGPEGYLYFSTDQGHIGRLKPVSESQSKAEVHP